ncbi:Lrp/AsnC family transcriptional regulator [Candidatus Woesearchaeota archaeon]|nr:Lrp/AsnC family transcriptional regulator [Candidatus Woesearchaeota archaeon]
MKLESTDIKLLHELSKNCRSSVTTLAKNVRVSKSTILYKIKRLESLGIIKGYQTIVDNSRLGNIYGRITLKINNIDEKSNTKIISFLKLHKSITWFATVHGIADFAIALRCDSINQFNSIVHEIHKEIGKYIESQEISIAYKIYHCAANIIIGKPLVPAVCSTHDSSREDLNETENRILEALINDPTISIINLAKRCSCTTKTALAKKRSLEKKEIIMRYQVILNTEMLGYETYHVFWKFKDYDARNLLAFKENLLQMKETLYVDESLSRSYIESEFLVHNQRELYKLVDDLRNKFPNTIRDYDILLIYEIHKDI